MRLPKTVLGAGPLVIGLLSLGGCGGREEAAVLSVAKVEALTTETTAADLPAGSTGACPVTVTSGPGITVAAGVTYFPNDTYSGYHVTEIDTTINEVHVNAPHPSWTEDALTVAAHAASLPAARPALVEINANYFDEHPWPCGRARGSGHLYTSAYAEAVNCVTTLAWSTPSAGPATARVIVDGSDPKNVGFRPEYTDMVTGGGSLISNGCRTPWNTGKLEVGRDCVAAGLNRDRSRFVFLVTDNYGCDGKQLQDVLLKHGVTDAIHLDGGGSAKMWLKNRPAGGSGYVNNEAQDRLVPVAIFARAKTK